MKKGEARILAKAIHDFHHSNVPEKAYKKEKKLRQEGFYQLTKDVYIEDTEDYAGCLWLCKNTDEPQFKGEPLACIVPFSDCYDKEELFNMLCTLKWIYI